MEKLALYGGTPVKTTPYGTGKRFGNEELKNLEEALEQNTLFYWKGNMTKRLCKKFAEMYGVEHCVATSSGTASIHVALGALGIRPGDEVITSPITDMGSIVGILYQNAIPVFADLDPNTYIMTPESIEKKITARTKAIVVVHLAGCSAEIDKIVELARKHSLYVIEDCAQSYGTKYKGKYVGTFGDVGCFSLNDFKHISAGDGGMVITSDLDIYHKALMFSDKNYNRLGKEVVKSVPYIAPNYRMNELTAAVGIAQLDKVDWICARRHELGERLNKGLQGIKGIKPHKILDDCYSSYWFYMFRIDESELGATRAEFVKALAAEGIICAAGYIPCCVYQYEMFKNRTAFPGNTHFPFDGTHGARVEYNDGDCPIAEAILSDCVKLTVNEFHTEKDIDETVEAIKKVATYFSK
jgi:dTDP-4-amino-4,6-dideoxygalactose transaminase